MISQTETNNLNKREITKFTLLSFASSYHMKLYNIVYYVDCSGKPWSYIGWKRDGNWNVERPHWGSSGWARDG